MRKFLFILLNFVMTMIVVVVARIRSKGRRYVVCVGPSIRHQGEDWAEDTAWGSISLQWIDRKKHRAASPLWGVWNQWNAY